MLIWIAIALLTVAAAYALLQPLFRSDTDATEEVEPSLAVFADQLAEIDREAERGLLPPEEAETARREIARRLLRARKQDTRLSRAPWRRKAAALAVAAAVPVLGFSAYSLLGEPAYRDQPLALRQTGPAGPMSMEAMIEQVEGRLAEAPDDGVGWGVIAPIYLGTGRYEEAAAAFEKAIDLDGPTAVRFTGLGEALTLADRGNISIRAEAAFEKALALEPDALKPRVFLAIAARQRGDAAEALGRWQLIVDGADGTEPWAPLARRELAALGRPDLLPVPEGTPAASGPMASAPMAGAPGGAGGAAPAGGGPTDAMIEGMVSRLATRLAENGGTAEEWVQLIRSELVLGRPARAGEALMAGLQDLADDPEAAAELKAGAASLGIAPGNENGAGGLGQ